MDLFANLEIRGGFLKLPCYYFSRCSGSIGCFIPRGSITNNKGCTFKVVISFKRAEYKYQVNEGTLMYNARP